jgi:hypothetical protein
VRFVGISETSIPFYEAPPYHFQQTFFYTHGIENPKSYKEEKAVLNVLEMPRDE